MEAFQVHKGKLAVLNRSNVDTDQIIPKQFLKRIERTGYGRFAFFDWRYLNDGSDNPEFELNKPEAAGASILVAGENFGCGSSREHAPWALGDYGFKVIIAPSFADIFHQNCLKNGLLPIRVEEEFHQKLIEKARKPHFECMIDLEKQEIFEGTDVLYSFSIDPYWKDMLINGHDEISLTFMYDEQIKTYEKRRRVWLA